MSEASRQVLGFSDQVLRFLERVEHRVAKSPWEREAAFQLRFEAYERIGRRIGFQKAGVLDILYDPLFDDDPNGFTTMTFVDGELAGTVRVNVGFDERAVLPGLKVYADAIVPILRARRVIVEFTRLAAKLSISSLFPQLAYVVMRPAYMAAVHFDADFAIASPRAEHIAFYRRTFGGTIWCTPRVYPGFTVKAACMGSNIRAVRSRIETRYPFYKSTPGEREALFGSPEGMPDSIEKAATLTRYGTRLRLVAELSACA
jgi:hypothetical protein